MHRDRLLKILDMFCILMAFSLTTIISFTPSFAEQDEQCDETYKLEVNAIIEQAENYFENHRYEDAKEAYSDAQNKIDSCQDLFTNRYMYRISEALADIAFAYDELPALVSGLYQYVYLDRKSNLPENDPDTLESIYDLAEYNRSVGLYAKAEELHLEAWRLRKEVLGPGHTDTLSSALALALLYKDQNRLEEAIDLLNHVLDHAIYALGWYHSLTLSASAKLAMMLSNEPEEFQHAKDLIDNVLMRSTLLHGEAHLETLLIKAMRATILSRIGEEDEARQIFDELRDNLEQAADLLDSPIKITIMEHMADFYVSEQEISIAINLYENIKNICERLFAENSYKYYIAQANYFNMLFEASSHVNLERAERDYKNSLEGARSVLPRNAMHPQLIEHYQNFAMRHVESSELQNASDTIKSVLEMHRDWILSQQRGAVGSSQRRNAARSARTTLRLALTFGEQVNADEVAAAAILSMKGLSVAYESTLNQVFQQHVSSLDEEKENIDQIDMLLSGLWTQYGAFEGSGNTAALAETRAAIDRALRKLDEIALENRLDLPRHLKSLRPRDIQRAMPRNAALIEYVVYQRHYGEDRGKQAIGAVVFRRDLPPVFKDLDLFDFHDENDVLGQDLRLLSALHEPHVSHADIRQAGRRVYDRLIKPFHSEISRKQELYIAPDDELHQLPLTLLRNAEGRPLTQLKEVHLVPNGRALVPTIDRVDHDGRRLAIGAPNFDTTDLVDRLPPLPGAKAELESLAAFGFEAPLLDLNATEAAMREIRRPPMILHIATHSYALKAEDAAIIDGDDLSRVALAFSIPPHASGAHNDGALLGTDIAQMPLYGTQLVVISACSSGIGGIWQGEGSMSVAHAFRLAGAEAVIMSYWPVDDHATQAFMGDFYENLLKALEENKDSPFFHALRETQEDWRQNGRHPRDWAAFALIENRAD